MSHRDSHLYKYIVSNLTPRAEASACGSVGGTQGLAEKYGHKACHCMMGLTSGEKSHFSFILFS